MIIGKLGQGAEERFLPAPLQAGLKALREMDWQVLPEGKYEIRGEDIFAVLSEYETAPWEQKRPESHSEYIDIQYMAAGSERIGWSLLPEQPMVSEDCRPGQDLIFYGTAPGETLLLLQPEMFAVFFPEDVHRPSCAAAQIERVRKVVVKIRRSLLR